LLTIAHHHDFLTQSGLSSIEQVKSFHGECLKRHRHGRRDVLQIPFQSENGRSTALFLKRNWRPYTKDGLKSLLRRGSVWSASRQEYANSRALVSAGVRVACPVAYGEQCSLFREKFSFLITEAAPGMPIDQFLRDTPDRTARRLVLDALARFVRRFHNAGFTTPDLFTRHVFVDTHASEPSFCLIDVARLNVTKRLRPRKRARDLAALNVTAPLRLVSARERLRFLRIYAGQRDKPLAHLIARRVSHLLTRRKYRDFSAFPSRSILA
jgi:hypothetical protein